ncbi:MAG: DUF459 domain-containing protein [Myxococcota bacterium]|nr:DUF459 domain-containing protein [Myxococcota bacterium]
MPETSKKPTTPLAVIAICWALALGLGVYHGAGLGEDAERKLALEETTEARSELPRFLAWLGKKTGFSKVEEATSGPKNRLYDADHSVGEVLATLEREAAAEALEPEPEVQEPAPPSPLVEPKRVLIMGASSMQYELGRALERAYKEREGVEVKRFGRHSTGLARPDYFDWPAKAIALADEFKPDLVIAQYGGNDGQGITDRSGKAVARFGTEEWEATYHARVTEVVSAMQERGAEVVMLGMPVMRKIRFRKKIARINEVTAEAVEASGAVFIGTLPMTADKDGGYRRRAEIDGRMRIIRATDGIHMTAHGATMVSREVIALLEARVDSTKL